MILIASKNNKTIKTNNNNKIKYLDSFCNLRSIKDNNNILILNNLKVSNEGIIEYFDYFLEEVFITLNIDLVISNKYSKKLDEICTFYNIPVFWS